MGLLADEPAWAGPGVYRGWNLPETVRRHVTCDGLFTPTFIEAGIPISVGRSGRAIP